MALHENHELNGKYSDENKGINCFLKLMDQGSCWNQKEKTEAMKRKRNDKTLLVP